MDEQVLVLVLLGFVCAFALMLTGGNGEPVASVNWDGATGPAAATTVARSNGKSRLFVAFGLLVAVVLAVLFAAGNIATRSSADGVNWLGDSVNWTKINPNGVNWTGDSNTNGVNWTGSVNWSKYNPNNVEWLGDGNTNGVNWTGSVNWSKYNPNNVEWLGSSVNWN